MPISAFPHRSGRAYGLLVALILAFVVLVPSAWAQTFPKLTGRVVDDARLLDPARMQALTDRLATLEQQSGRQLVVVTLPSLQDYDITDYGYQLGRAWGIGEKDKNTGALLIVAPNERKVGIEVGYGLEGILTDALSSRIIRQSIVPRFKANDYPGGIEAGADAIATLLTLPPDEARAQAAAAAKDEKGKGSGNGAVLIVLLLIFLFSVLPMILNRRNGRRHSGSGLPIILWGPGIGGSDWGDRGGGGWGGFGGGGGFGDGGGFSGGGGSFGGGGASGDW